MKKQTELLDWYNKLNEEDEGIAKITVPVLDIDTSSDGEVINKTNTVDDYEENDEVTGKDHNQNGVVDRDKSNSLVSFVATRRIQDILVRLADLDEPYEKDSVERQELIDTAKGLYVKLGEYISSL